MKTSKKAIVFDFDDTLNNATATKDQLTVWAKDLGAKSTTVKEAYAEAVNELFTTKKFCDRVFPDDQEKNRKFTSQTEGLVKRAKKYNYPGVHALLGGLSRQYSLMILTYGDQKFQLQKITDSGLKKYFDRIYVIDHRDKTGALLDLRKKYGDDLVFVDDSKLSCEAALKVGIRTIRVKKGMKDREYLIRLGRQLTSILK